MCAHKVFRAIKTTEKYRENQVREIGSASYFPHGFAFEPELYLFGKPLSSSTFLSGPDIA